MFKVGDKVLVVQSRFPELVGRMGVVSRVHPMGVTGAEYSVKMESRAALPFLFSLDDIAPFNGIDRAIQRMVK